MDGSEEDVEQLGLTLPDSCKGPQRHPENQSNPGVEKMNSGRLLKTLFPLAIVAASLLLAGCEHAAEPAAVSEPVAAEPPVTERSAEELLEQH